SADIYWYWDDGIVLSGGHPDPYIVYWHTTGEKHIWLWVDNEGCYSDTIAKKVTVNLTPETPEMYLPEHACVNELVHISGFSTMEGSTLWWHLNTTLHTTEWGFTNIWREEGYQVFALYAEMYGCVSDTITDSIWISEYPFAIIQLDADEICKGAPILVYADSTDNIDEVSYTWEPLSF